jgi:hypothetical protein
MLRGHVEFLTRLAHTPELLSQFCVFTTKGTTLLPAETAQIILEQARRTSHFLGGPADDARPAIGSVAEALDLRVDLAGRVHAVKELLRGTDLGAVEVNTLLLQEVTITGALRQYTEQRRGEARGSEAGREAFRSRGKRVYAGAVRGVRESTRPAVGESAEGTCMEELGRMGRWAVLRNHWNRRGRGHRGRCADRD